ncbi:MAG: hypothetical protein ACRD3W_30605, partial [Terriglobales bacterium]
REERQQGKGKPGAALRQRAAEPVKEPAHAGKRPHGGDAAPAKAGAGPLKKARDQKAEPKQKATKPAKQDKPAKQPPPKADKPKKADADCKDKKKKKGKDKCDG